MAFQIKSRDQILTDMVANYVSDNTNVDDFVPGSAIRSMLEAVASSLEEVYTSMHLGNRRAGDEIPNNVFGLNLKEGVRANVVLTFTKEIGVASEVTVSLNTRVSSGANVFATSESLVIPAGTSLGTVNAIAEDVGRRYNVASGAISTVEDTIVGIESVTNAAAATGGEDSETEFDFNYRFNLHVEGLGLCTRSGLEAGALSVVGITDANAIDLDPPVNNVNAELYVDDNTPTGVLDAKLVEVRNVIDGDGTSQFPGYRAVGVNVNVLKPTITTQNISITMTIAREYEIASMEDVVENRVAQFINRLRIGTSLKIAEVLAAIILTPGVVNASISTPSADVSASSSQVVRSGTFLFTTTRQP